MKRPIPVLILLLILLPAAFCTAEENLLSFNAVPFGTVPLSTSSEYFKFGYGMEAGASYIPSRFKNFGIGITAEYFILPIQTQDSVGVFSGNLGPVFRQPLTDRLSLFASAAAGYYIYNGMGWTSENANRGGLSYSGGGGAVFQIADPFSVGLGISYDYYSNLYQGLGISLYTRLDFGVESRERPVRDYSSRDIEVEPMESGLSNKDEKGKGVEIRDMNFLTLFPVLYKYYDSHPIGTIRVKNFENKAAEEISLKFFMDRYMDNPTFIDENFTLKPGEERIIEIFGLFTEDMMDITEGTKASAELTVSYTMSGKEKKKEYAPALDMNNRNALTWDDDRKIASFITAKDPEVLTFSKKVTNWMQEFENPSVDENLQKGMVLFEAVKSYGVRYEVDPSTPFASLTDNTEVVDFIQFPRQTLSYTTGDCDDLTALYTSLLESVGVETGIITIPGHIYMAFALKSSAEDIRSKSSRPDEFIYEADKVWVPIEITMFQQGFEEAWLEGAKEWRTNKSKEQSQFYPTQSSWQQYQAVGFKESSSGIEMPRRSDVTSEFVNTLSRYVEQEIYPQESVIREKMAGSSRKYIYENKLAVLYARYGLYDKALETFRQINEQRSFIPSLLNTGNIYYIREDYKNALSWYNKVINSDGRNKKALLGAARCNHELENYGTVKENYLQLKKVDADLAKRFAYLDLKGEEGHRAADALGLKEIVLWEEEE